MKAIDTGLRVLSSWIEDDSQDALINALNREPDKAALLIGLSDVARLLTLELAIATDRSEGKVIQDLAKQVEDLRNQ